MKRVSLLSDMHLRNIRTKLLLVSRNHEATKHLEVGSGADGSSGPERRPTAQTLLASRLRRAPGSWCRLSRKSSRSGRI